MVKATAEVALPPQSTIGQVEPDVFDN